MSFGQTVPEPVEGIFVTSTGSVTLLTANFHFLGDSVSWKLYKNLSLLSFVFSLSFGRSGYRRRAFRSIFARSVITPLAKDAASIPNALGAPSNEQLAISPERAKHI